MYWYQVAVCQPFVKRIYDDDDDDDDVPIWLHLTMYQTIRLADYCRTILGNGLTG